MGWVGEMGWVGLLGEVGWEDGWVGLVLGWLLMVGWVGGLAFKPKQSKSPNDVFSQNILGDFNHDFPHEKLPKN